MRININLTSLRSSPSILRFMNIVVDGPSSPGYPACGFSWIPSDVQMQRYCSCELLLSLNNDLNRKNPMETSAIGKGYCFRVLRTDNRVALFGTRALTEKSFCFRGLKVTFVIVKLFSLLWSYLFIVFIVHSFFHISSIHKQMFVLEEL